MTSPPKAPARLRVDAPPVAATLAVVQKTSFLHGHWVCSNCRVFGNVGGTSERTLSAALWACHRFPGGGFRHAHHRRGMRIVEHSGLPKLGRYFWRVA